MDMPEGLDGNVSDSDAHDSGIESSVGARGGGSPPGESLSSLGAAASALRQLLEFFVDPENTHIIPG
jgi:hypothetical protein